MMDAGINTLPTCAMCCRNGLEMGEGYQEIAASLKDKQPGQ